MINAVRNFDCFFLRDRPWIQRLDRIFIELGKTRRHDHKCQKQRQPHKHLIWRRCLGTERRTQKVQYDNDPCKGCHHDQDGGRQRNDR